ncbi:hypothetical protein GHT09_001020 [Marmota monax]|uniref:Uncharacterized protein n=1 Tax=Marmota monax TaxID=9995 RepID=A0A834PXF8_MARMO|nr:hypothetical protein GHT09_001020 [Marmota monax]
MEGQGHQSAGSPVALAATSGAVLPSDWQLDTFTPKTHAGEGPEQGPVIQGSPAPCSSHQEGHPRAAPPAPEAAAHGDSCVTWALPLLLTTVSRVRTETLPVAFRLDWEDWPVTIGTHSQGSPSARLSSHHWMRTSPQSRGRPCCAQLKSSGVLLWLSSTLPCSPTVTRVPLRGLWVTEPGILLPRC